MRIVVGVLGVLIALLGTSRFLTSETIASWTDTEYAQAEIIGAVPVVFDLEGSPDTESWTNNPDTVLAMKFTPDSMALKVGEANAVYAPIHLRAAAETNIGGSATISEQGLSATDNFAQALRGVIFADTPGGSAAVVDGVTPIASGNLQGMTSTTTFGVEAPTTSGQPGAVQSLCVKVWLDNNDFLLGGTQSGVQTARWVIDATADEV